MKLYERKRRESSIVLVGDFFPLLLTPAWFIRNKLLPNEDAANIETSISIKEITKFSLAAISVEVQESKLVLKSSEEHFDYLIKDLCEGVLSLLPEVKITAVGLNRVLDIECSTLEFWHFLGDSLVPKSLWNDAIPESPKVGLTSLQLQAGRQTPDEGLLNFNVSWLNAPKLLHFSMNNHFADDSDAELDASLILNSFWNRASEDFERIFSGVIDRLAGDYQK